jgi:two-component system, OmpR family, sensor histidine kinase BaeS
MPQNKPPWWPEDEPWPPRQPPWAWSGRRDGWHGPPGSGPGGWQGRPWRRRGFIWRMAIGFGLFVVVVVSVVALAIALVGGLFGLVGLSDNTRLAALVVLALGVFAIAGAGRSIGRAAAPVDDLIEMAGRVEAGDLSARVEERGPREVRTLARAFNAMSARLQADEASRKTLLTDITHELRTPLTVIQGNLEGLLDGVYPADDEHLSTILDETRTLSRLIDDLRTLALADRGALDLRREDVDLAVLANETVAGVRAAADAAGVSMTVRDVDADLPHVSADPTRIREVLGNLLSNALRHTPAGGSVNVDVARGSGTPLVSVTVRDSGPGIAPEVLPRVFERFVRTPDSPGSGLGLAIARDLVAAHGGTIVAESPAGGGTAIRFSLPVRPPG